MANSVDPHETLFDLGPHCLFRYKTPPGLKYNIVIKLSHQDFSHVGLSNYLITDLFFTFLCMSSEGSSVENNFRIMPKPHARL